jgi:hypothetical protein
MRTPCCPPPTPSLSPPPPLSGLIPAIQYGYDPFISRPGRVHPSGNPSRELLKQLRSTSGVTGGFLRRRNWKGGCHACPGRSPLVYDTDAHSRCPHSVCPPYPPDLYLEELSTASAAQTTPRKSQSAVPLDTSV